MTARPDSGGLSVHYHQALKRNGNFTSAARLPFQCGANARHMIIAKEIKQPVPGEAQKNKLFVGRLRS
jgi:hypothetical protein